MKTAIITGAAGNLGSAVVDEFVKEGYKVLATVSPGKEDQIDQKGAVVFPVDLTDEKEVEASFSKIIEKHSPINAALFLAGGYQYGNIDVADGAILQKMININFMTAFFLSRKVFQHMKENGKGGRLVFVGARPSLDPKAGKDSFAYALSKSLIFELSELLNAEGSTHGITSTVVVPSIIDTPPNRKAMADADFKKWVKPEEIARVMAFVCSEAASSVREAVIKVYGKS